MTIASTIYTDITMASRIYITIAMSYRIYNIHNDENCKQDTTNYAKPNGNYTTATITDRIYITKIIANWT